MKKSYFEKKYGLIIKSEEIFRKLLEQIEINRRQELEVLKVIHNKNYYNSSGEMDWLLESHPNILTLKDTVGYNIFNILFIYNNEYYILDKRIYMYFLSNSSYKIDSDLLDLYQTFDKCSQRLGNIDGLNYKTWLLDNFNIKIQEKIDFNLFYLSQNNILIKNKKIKI